MFTDKIIKALKNPNKVIEFVGRKGILNWIPDDKYLAWFYKQRMGETLNLDNPKNYNEKLQYLKLKDRNPEYTKLVDKFEVRKYVASKIGEEHLIPLLGVWNNVEEIEWEALPNQFVLKTTHDSGGVVICKDKNKLDFNAAKKKLKKSLSNNYYDAFREWPYKDVKPRIIAEKYMVDESGYELKDFKFFCFDGSPKIMFIATDRNVDTKFDFFDMDFNHLPVKQYYDNNVGKEFKEPKNFQLMKKYASVLSEDIPHVRVDFYNINGKVYFGELTFYHFSGFKRFEPSEYDELIGSWLDLTNI